ncbi:MAG: serine/threonine protein kinase [Candidatus Riflebacteria bacterium]|nr:serine/threonine protein kinase [Candidatus Riflebacteria bacterium]
MASDRLPVIPGFAVETAVGVGGQGVVYRACHLSCDRVVALKVLRVDRAADRSLAARFRREQELLERIVHPHVARFVAADPEGIPPWIATEFVEGGSLADRLARDRSGRSLPASEVIRLAVEMLDALGHLHERGILHRDVKPSNILFRCDGTSVLTDLGLARGEASERDVSLTAPGMLVGSVPYMAPELFAGAETTPRSDLFSLGVCLYEALCGTHPNAGRAIPPGFVAADPASARAGCPESLRLTIRGLLEPDPATRPASAQAARELLSPAANLLGMATVSDLPAPSSGSPDRGDSWSDRFENVAAVEQAGTRASVSGTIPKGRIVKTPPLHPGAPGSRRRRRFRRRALGAAAGLATVVAITSVFLAFSRSPSTTAGATPAPTAGWTATVDPDRTARGASEEMERLGKKIGEQIDRFNTSVKLSRAGAFSQTFAELRVVTNVDEVMPALTNALSMVRGAVRTGDRAGVRGPIWLRLDAVATVVVNGCRYMLPARHGALVRKQLESLLPVVESASGDPWRRCFALDLASQIRSQLDRGREQRLRRAEALDTVGRLLGELTDPWTRSPDGLLCRLQFACHALTSREASESRLSLYDDSMAMSPAVRRARLVVLALAGQAVGSPMPAGTWRATVMDTWVNVFGSCVVLATDRSSSPEQIGRAIEVADRIWAAVDRTVCTSQGIASLQAGRDRLIGQAMKQGLALSHLDGPLPGSPAGAGAR